MGWRAHGWVLAAVLGLGACDEATDTVDDDTDQVGQTDVASDTVSYHRDVRPIFEKNCVSCHQDGGVAPFSMVFDDATWGDEAPIWFSTSAAAVEAGTMPPWMPADDCHPLQGVRGLGDAALETIATWADEGFQLGQPEDFVARQATEVPDLGEPTWTLSGADPYTPDVTRPDDYRCMVLDHTVDVDRWMKGFSVLPDQVDMVHHAIVYRLDASYADAVSGWDEADDGVGYTCFGSPGTWEADTIATWAPGQLPEVYGEDEARKIPAGSIMVLQVHYNTLNLREVAPKADATAVQMWLLPEGEQPKLELFSVPFPKTDLMLPAGDPNVVAVEEVTPNVLLGPVQVRGIYPHMHQLGTHIRVDVVREDGDEACLVNVPAWDFNWQQSYLFESDKPVSVKRGDKVRLTCGYDNSSSNQPVVNGEQQEPRDVRWGDSSLDEMCLAYLYVTRPILAAD